jgi:hypothetical protein
MGLRLSHKIVFTLVIFALGFSGIILAIRGAAHKPGLIRSWRAPA